MLGAVTANSAFHGTRLDVGHIRSIMENLVSQAETRAGIRREEIASSTMFVSHETYTPARGGSASAEIHALRGVFGDAADRIVIANTKGFTGHAMGAGIEDVVAVKALETGIVPPVANFREVDPELGPLNLSRGGAHGIEYALRLGAGFGSQISMTLTRRIPSAGPRPAPNALGYAYRIANPEAWQKWLAGMAGEGVELEVAHRTLRVRDAGAAEQLKPAERPAIAAQKPAAIQQPAAKPPVPAARVERPVLAEAPKQQRPPVKAAPAKAEPVPDPVREKVLALVVEKTGYPLEMLDLDLDLEADLGIDTVKQAEMFAAIRAAYDIPRDQNVKLRDFPTLARVMQFVYDRRPDLKPAAQPVPLVAEVVTPEREAKLAPAPAAQKAAAAVDGVRDKVLDLVVEKTGYPKEMLDLDLDLEADLGIDTVKQAEMFAAIRAAYDIPRDPNVKLRDFPTLARVMQFVYDRRPDLKPAAQPVLPAVEDVPPKKETKAAPAVATAKTAAAVDGVREKVLDLVVEKTGYPKEMLDPELDLEADLGIDTVKQAEMFAAIRAAYDIPRDPNMKLRDFPTLARVMQFVYDRRPDLKTAAPVAAVEDAPPESPAKAVPLAAAPKIAAGEDAIRDKVLDLVVEKTGYPKEMLDLELDLEADLGIDTVKQAEMFAAIRAAYNIPRDPNVKLRDFPTLGHVIQFARDRASAPVSRAPEEEKSPAAPPAEAMSFEAANRVPRRVPVPALRPPLEVCKLSGVSLGSGQRVFLMADRGGAGEALAEKLRALGVEVVTTEDALGAGPVAGVYWLPALDDEGDLSAMTIEDWRLALDIRVKALYRTMRRLYAEIAGPGTFLIAATRLGGRHGYDETGAIAPLGGAVTGFTKTYKRERPDALVKAVDFGAAASLAEIADLLIQETLRDPGAVETGYAEGYRWTVGLEERPVAAQAGMTLGRDTVFLVTGAAGSIVSAITADLAAASGGTFHLLDLVPEPDSANRDLKRFATDKEGLKRELFARIQARGERATPALVEKELAALERAQAAQSAIDAVRASGGTAHYYSVNLADGPAVAKVIADVRERSGRIDVLLHAAGIERSHVLPDKDEREFNLVFDVKSDGLFHLLRAIGDMPLGALVGFSSVAGRFGNSGQADYSAANDLLCKVASSFRRTRPATRAIAIDWTAWGGIGMATRGSIPKMMQMAGIDMLPPEAGIPWIRRELTAAGASGEVLVAGALGVLGKEWEAAGGLEAAALPQAPMIAGPARMDLDGRLTVETPLDPVVQPFLHDHAIDGTPVLPGVMGIEAFAEAALAVAPGWHVEAVEDVDFLAPFKFYRGEPREVTVEAQFHPEGEGLIAECRIAGRRLLPGQPEPQLTTHFTGRVRLAKHLREAEAGPAPDPTRGSPINRAEIYRVYFHGPAYQVVERAWWTGEGVVGEMASGLPANHVPAGRELAMAPRLIELCFQTAGLWEMAVQHRMGLPRHVGSVRLYRKPETAAGPMYAIVTADPAAASFHASVVDAAGTRYLEVSGYQTVVFREDIDSRVFAAAEAVMA